MLTAVERKWRFPTPGHQRVLKLRGDAQQIFVNGEFSGGSSGFWDYTIYVNPYMVVRPEWHYTKHIYVNSQRIASNIGNPEDYEGGDPTVPGSPAGKKVLLEEVVEENFTELFGSIPDIEAAADTTLGMSDGGSGGEPHQYWFTADHLGSSAFVTDASGVAIQHLEYMAFGEVFVDERRTGFGTPYKFNAKELDCESGYYYYGARYYDPKFGRFLGVDPIAGDFPHVSSYNYAENSPVTNIDLHGLQALRNDMMADLRAAEGQGADVLNNYIRMRQAQGYQSASPKQLMDAGKAINMAGDLVTMTGVTFTLFSGGASSVLIPVGEAMSFAGHAAYYYGRFMDEGNQMNQEFRSDVLVDAAYEFVPSVLTAAGKSAKMSDKKSEQFLESLIKGHMILTEGLIEEGSRVRTQGDSQPNKKSSTGGTPFDLNHRLEKGFNIPSSGESTPFDLNHRLEKGSSSGN